MTVLTARRDPSTRGQVTILLVGLYLCLFVLAGAVVDGGRALATKIRVIGEAQEVARTGANVLSKRSLYAGGSDVDATRAVSAARAQLQADGYSGAVLISGSKVWVTVTSEEKTVLWRLAGIDSITLTETQSADAVRSAG